jgi:hypothetical protein
MRAPPIHGIMMAGAITPERKVIVANRTDIANGSEAVPEPLGELAKYLERALDRATSLIMIRQSPGNCVLYLGDPSGPRDELRQVGMIPASLADRILESTHSGLNTMQIGEQLYRFVRSFTQIEGEAAVVFSI